MTDREIVIEALTRYHYNDGILANQEIVMGRVADMIRGFECYDLAVINVRNLAGLNTHAAH